ncbi:energy transducer TonB family protein [Allomesorhizobium alhagi]|jgi:protein TonB|uniref:Protein TonB n=1 Tax=Mesorhizobium alhagi CCNWXJ12-2 TaxID=1107882 RepID=H0HST0_9HYPH|nr:TonB family protein [Mesorhizobium alhagi]EHK56217.1 TonB family protein [Mesorhizobium alhagi CCNWXJ12-2]
MEPAFAHNSGTWPLAGMHTLPLEPDDPRLAIPHNAFPARPVREERYVLTSDAALDKTPAEPLGTGSAAGKPSRSKRWKAAIAGSCAFHAAIALCFLAGIDESAKIAGADQAGIVQLGNANEDTAAAGEIDPAVADVSIITMLDAKPVETVTAEPVTDANAAEPVETVEPAAPVAETVEPVAEATVEPETPAQTAPVAEPETVEPAPQETATAVAEMASEILATDTVQPIDDENIVAPSAQAVEPALEPTAEAAPAAPAEPVTETPAGTMAEPLPEETFETLAAVAPIPEPRPEAPKPEKPVEKKRAAAKKEPAKPREQKSAEKRVAGSGGNAKADARRGETDGQANGKTAARSRGGNRQSAAGNAAVSNYPGKIVSKLRRALRYPAEAKRNKLRGEVRVAFTVSAGGGVGGVRVVRSSGSPVLDKAAVETVRRAAPFPAIPEGAGRSSWPFTVPLAFTR